MDKRVAFTLIELLVVIAVIGILSGLIVVSMSGTTQKATLAKAQIFSNSLRNSLMSNVVAEWKLDEGINAVANDTWGGINNGSLVGFIDTNAGYGDTHTSGWMSSSNCTSGTCLKFNGSNHVLINDNSSTQINSMTISSWVKGTGSGSKILSKRNNMSFYFLGFSGQAPYMGIGAGSNYDSITYSKAIDSSNWHFIGMSFDSSTKKGSLYVDGEISSKTMGYNLGDVSGRPVVIGAECITGTTIDNLFVGIIDEVRLYNIAAPTAKLQEQYYLGLNSLFLNGSIAKEEYLSRINEYAIK